MNKRKTAQRAILTLLISICSALVLGKSWSGFLTLAQEDDATSAGTVMEDEQGVPMVFVPEGSFMMGLDITQAVEACRERVIAWNLPTACDSALFLTEVPAHEVTVEAFWIDQFEVSFAQYRACAQDGQCLDIEEIRPRLRLEMGDPYPFNFDTFARAARFCAWRNARLPTEAEWEYAARGPESLLYPWGNEFDGTYANLCGASCGYNFDHINPQWDDDYDMSAPVGSFEHDRSWVNAYDMFGNVAEWTSTSFAPYAGYEHDPQYLEFLSMFIGHRTIRGGSYDSPHNLVTNAYRWGAPSDDYAQLSIGFRCARTPDEDMPIPTPQSTSLSYPTATPRATISPDN